MQTYFSLFLKKISSWYSKYFLWILIVWLIFDSISKFLAYTFLREKNIDIIWWLLSLSYITNPGIAFSFPLTGRLLSIITLILIFSIFLYYSYSEKEKKNTLNDIAFWLILAWALWNAWERIYKNEVIDFISLEYFAVFNLADSFIFLWACILIYLSFRK